MNMRTRIFNKMTAREVDDYLARGGNTIFVAVGVIEVHGAAPIDVETVIPEGFAVAMAEEADGLAMINLPYFFPGGTVVSNATVQVSIREGIDYLMMIGRSLVAQGFRKIIFVSGHMPAALYVNAMLRDFFQETKIHACHMDVGHIVMASHYYDGDGFQGFDDLANGAYRILGQEQFLPVDPDTMEMPPMGTPLNPIHLELSERLAALGGKMALYYEDGSQHCGGRAFYTEEERSAACEKGEKVLRAVVKSIDFERIKNALDAYQAHVQDIIKKTPRLGGKY